MKRLVAICVLLAACGSDEPTSLVVSTTFTVNQMFGTSSSYLQKYIGTELAFELTFPTFRTDKYMSTETCANTDAHHANTPRSVRSTVPEAQAELLDPLDQDWEVTLEFCEDPTQSTVAIDSVIDPYNLSFGCGVVPMEDQQFGDDRFPVISSVTAMRCNAIILDVINAYTIGNADFTMRIEAK